MSAPIEEEMKVLLGRMLEETGVSLRQTSTALVEFAALRAEQLAMYVGHADYDRIVTAVRDVVLLEAGILATQEADKVTRRMMEILAGGLRLLAAVIAGGQS